MDAAKIRLSEEEQRLVNDAQWILTKNGILQKVNVLLAELQSLQSGWLSSHPEALPVGALFLEPKISRGENYEGLPWLMLDQPRLFGKAGANGIADTFAVRSFFWWGHYFSTTLFLSGRWQEQFREVLARAKPLFNDGWWIATGDDPWDHSLSETNAVAVEQLPERSFRSHLHEHPFIKIGVKTDLRQWDRIVPLAFDHFRMLMRVMASARENGASAGMA